MGLNRSGIKPFSIRIHVAGEVLEFQGIWAILALLYLAALLAALILALSTANWT